MLLAIDIGNTNIAFGIYQQGTWTDHWRVRTVHDKMPDEYAVLFGSLLGNSGLKMRDITQTVLCSVVPPLTDTFDRMSKKYMGKEPLIVGPGIRTGVRIRTDNPAEVGADLVANAVAAYTKFQSNCIVDFGTALTFTAVAVPGDLLGVAIAPGLNSAAAALSSNTAQLPRVRLIPPSTAIGRNTTLSIQSGIVFGYIGLVESLVDRMKEELGSPVHVVATGGLAQVIAPLTDRFTEIDPWLTLEGLRMIAERNVRDPDITV
jgi:type III pantothenate kinase